MRVIRFLQDGSSVRSEGGRWWLYDSRGDLKREILAGSVEAQEWDLESAERIVPGPQTPSGMTPANVAAREERARREAAGQLGARPDITPSQRRDDAQERQRSLMQRLREAYLVLRGRR